jgi:hypothetical protein
MDGLERCPEYKLGCGRCPDWECGRLGKVPHVWIGIVDDLERCLEYGLSCGRYPACRMG